MSRRILFLCTGNSARSQMAEALLRKRAGDIFEVVSAGTDPKDEIYPPVVTVMREIGVDLAGKRPQGVEKFLGQCHFEKAIVVCSKAEEECPTIFGLTDRLFWPFDDPAAAQGTVEEKLGVCRRIRDEIDEKLCAWLRENGIEPKAL